jgi:flagellar motor switch protein FliG
MAEIFNAFDRQTEGRFLSALDESNRDAAQRIRSLMFVFDDLGKLDRAPPDADAHRGPGEAFGEGPEGRRRTDPQFLSWQHVTAGLQNSARRYVRARTAAAEGCRRMPAEDGRYSRRNLPPKARS